MGRIDSSQPTWTTLELSDLKSAGGATLETQDDGSVLAGGENPATDTYTLSATTELSGITAFRLETIPDASLPAGGSGRSPSGDFRLTRFAVAAGDAAAKDDAVSGRFVRIDLPGANKILSLAEVQVFAGGENVALERHREPIERRFRWTGEAGDRRQHRRPLLRIEIGHAQQTGGQSLVGGRSG